MIPISVLDVNNEYTNYDESTLSLAPESSYVYE